MERIKSWLRRAGLSRPAFLAAPRSGLGNHENRVRWVRAALQRVPAGGRLLDAGAGEQPYRAFCGHLRYVAQDFAQYDGQGDGRGLQTGSWNHARLDLVCDISRIPEPDGSFDAILCTEVLEHVAAPIDALRELARLLRPGGILILTAPFVSFTHFAPHHYHTGFNGYFYRHHLAALGFEIEEAGPNGNFFELIAQEIRRIPWAADRYAGEKMTWRERRASRRLLHALDRLSRRDRGSAEFAAYGLQIFAVRRGPD